MKSFSIAYLERKRTSRTLRWRPCRARDRQGSALASRKGGKLGQTAPIITFPGCGEGGPGQEGSPGYNAGAVTVGALAGKSYPVTGRWNLRFPSHKGQKGTSRGLDPYAGAKGNRAAWIIHLLRGGGDPKLSFSGSKATRNGE